MERALEVIRIGISKWSTSTVGKLGITVQLANRPRVCFICHLPDHVVERCPAWKKPPVAAQYFGSANTGLGFYYVDVEAIGDRFKHWVGMENFGVVTIEEGVIDEAGVLENLKALFDKEWNWQFRKLNRIPTLLDSHHTRRLSS